MQYDNVKKAEMLTLITLQALWFGACATWRLNLYRPI